MRKLKPSTYPCHQITRETSRAGQGPARKWTHYNPGRSKSMPWTPILMAAFTWAVGHWMSAQHGIHHVRSASRCSTIVGALGIPMYSGALTNP